MHFYDSIVVFERGAHTKKCAVETGGWPEELAERVKRKLS